MIPLSPANVVPIFLIVPVKLFFLFLIACSGRKHVNLKRNGGTDRLKPVSKIF